MARLGSFDDLLSERTSDQPPRVAEIARALRRIILDDFPEAVEVVRLGDKAASYGVGPKKMSESHVYVSPQKGYVNLGFWHGVNVSDPEGLLEGTGKKLRHVKVRTVETAESPAVRALVAAALAERHAALGLV
ncbi:MAG: DUF1801 domain-containing protein [Bacteroidota bacterium]